MFLSIKVGFFWLCVFRDLVTVVSVYVSLFAPYSQVNFSR